MKEVHRFSSGLISFLLLEFPLQAKIDQTESILWPNKQIWEIQKIVLVKGSILKVNQKHKCSDV